MRSLAEIEPGVLMMSSVRRTSSKQDVNFVSLSRMRHLAGRDRLVRSKVRLRACWVVHSRTGSRLVTAGRQPRSASHRQSCSVHTEGISSILTHPSRRGETMTPLDRSAGRSATTMPMLLLVLGCLMALSSPMAAAGSSRATIAGHATGTLCAGYLPPGTTVGIASTPDDGGYWIANDTGDVVPCGDAMGHGSVGIAPVQPVVGIVATPDGGGYLLVASDGGVFALGDAHFFGSTALTNLNQPIVGMAATPDGMGYWLVGSDGGVFTFGDAGFFGSSGGIVLNQPVVGMASTADGRGYWLVASDGGVFSFGDAAFHGSSGNVTLNQPIVGMAATPGGGGYWLVASDGGIFTYGNAGFYGSAGNIHLNEPIVGMEVSGSGSGYRLVASDGGVFTFGSSVFFGSAVSPLPLGICTVSMSIPSPTGGAVETATIRSTVANAPVIVTVNFRFKASSFGGSTDGLGNAAIAFAIGHPKVQYPVGVIVNVGNGTATCKATFTPR
jgi:hypothetical protein